MRTGCTFSERLRADLTHQADLKLRRYSPAVQESITLSKEKVQIATPQGGTYLVSRYVYRAAFVVQAGQLLGEAAGVGGLRPGGIEVVHSEWVGGVVLEAEGSAEQAQLLLARVSLAEFLG